MDPDRRSRSFWGNLKLRDFSYYSYFLFTIDANNNLNLNNIANDVRTFIYWQMDSLT